MTRRNKSVDWRPVLAAFLAAVLWHRGAEAGDFSVCIDKSSPTAKMEAALAQAAAHSQGVTARLAWFDGDADDDGYAARDFRKLAQNRCELILGYPVDAQSQSIPEGLQATAAYARTGFVLVTRDRQLRSLDALPEGSRVAATYLTAPNLYFADHKGLKSRVYLSDRETLRGLVHKEVTAAMLWRPFLVAQLQGHPLQGLSVSNLQEPHSAWNLVALYAAPSSSSAQQFEAGIAELGRDGKLAAILQPYADAPAGVAAPMPTAQHRVGGGRLIRTANKVHLVAAAQTMPAIYTEAQASAGKLAFAENCAMCHGSALQGRAGPPLRGPTFANPDAGFHVGDIFKIVSQNMPAPAPGTLPHETYVDIMAFLLQQNGYPAGQTALTFESATQSKVKLVFREEHSD